MSPNWGVNTTRQAQHLLYRLLALMPSIHQKRTFQALLLAFLTPHESVLPEHNPLRSASSISRFLNHYRWGRADPQSLRAGRAVPAGPGEVVPEAEAVRETRRGSHRRSRGGRSSIGVESPGRRLVLDGTGQHPSGGRAGGDEGLECEVVARSFAPDAKTGACAWVVPVPGVRGAFAACGSGDRCVQRDAGRTAASSWFDMEGRSVVGGGATQECRSDR